MLNDKDKLKLIRNVTRALVKSEKLTKASAVWLTANYALKTSNWPIDAGNSRIPTPEQMRLFNVAFSLWDYITNDTDLNHCLGWVIYWDKIAKTSTSSDITVTAHKAHVLEFRQRIEVIQCVRKAIGLKNFAIRFNRRDWKNRVKHYHTIMRARDMNEACRVWRGQWRHPSHYTGDVYYLKRVKELPGVAYYMLPTNQGIPLELF
jgi:hypothetical protein